MWFIFMCREQIGNISYLATLLHQPRITRTGHDVRYKRENFCVTRIHIASQGHASTHTVQQILLLYYLFTSQMYEYVCRVRLEILP